MLQELAVCRLDLSILGLRDKKGTLVLEVPKPGTTIPVCLTRQFQGFLCVC